MEGAAATPVIVITGFLGSGKTSLLQRLLAAPQLADTAVLVNEFGEVGLDHHLLRRIDGEVVLLQSGCLCCTIRGDLGGAIRDLHSRRERGELPFFRRLVVETTGLADPVPILATIMAEPVIRHHFRLGNVVTTVDAVNGTLHLDRQPESVKQVAVADRILITKTDLASPERVAVLRRRLATLNPSAPLVDSNPERHLDPDLLLDVDLYDPKGQSDEVRYWLAAELRRPSGDGHRRAHDVNRHDERIHAFCLRFDQPLDWTAFGIWLSMLLGSRGTDVLRVKGLLNVAGSDRPLVVHGVQHLVHPPFHLEHWPDADRASRIVFIVRDIDQASLERSLAAFNRLANP
ncbi:MAG: CobW family GTP-binding protein [Stellaceae bacterium]